MAYRRLRWLGVALLGSVGVGCLALTSAVIAHADDSALIMGGTGDPDPDETYLVDVYNDYILPNIAPESAIPTTLVTPEEGFPLTAGLTFDASVAQGLGILQEAIATQPSGIDTVVFGFSQSATIATLYLDELANGSIENPPAPADLSFVLAGDPNNPDGGMFERFDGLYIPGFNETYSGATPDLDYPTDIYTIQYDGFGDFPQYPINFLADINAIFGLYYDHLSATPAYETLTPAQVATAIVEPVSPGAAGDTTYDLIPTQTLPLLEPLVQAGAPQWMIDLLNPDLRVLVDLGYGNIGGSVDPDYANLPTPASLIELINPITVTVDLAKGAVQGITAALVDTGVLPESDMPDTYPFVPSLDPGLTINLGQPSESLVSEVTSVVGTLLRDLNIPAFGSESSSAADVITNLVEPGLSSDLMSLWG
ncbi:PE-PPE domain-containing protein [Mycobacterium sp.]|uniref:PE-PPE domain-containing protein n=1 Tax=Mycobacterium sp. TaxID=1785 RepID=UPI003F954F23